MTTEETTEETKESTTGKIWHTFVTLGDRCCLEPGCGEAIKRKIVVEENSWKTDEGKSPASFPMYNWCYLCTAKEVAKRLATRAQVRIKGGVPGWRERLQELRRFAGC